MTQLQVLLGETYMNGWERLAVVIAAPFSLFGAVLGYEEDREYAYITVTDPHLVWLAQNPGEEPITIGDRPPPQSGAADSPVRYFWGAFWQSNLWQSEMSGCDRSTITGELRTYADVSVSLACDLSNKERVSNAFVYAMFPAIFMWLVVAVIGWIVAGFRQGK